MVVENKENSTQEKTDSDVEKSEEKTDDDKDKEVLLIQDTGFNVMIQAPGIEPFDLPVRFLWQ